MDREEETEDPSVDPPPHPEDSVNMAGTRFGKNLWLEVERWRQPQGISNKLPAVQESEKRQLAICGENSSPSKAK